MDTVTARLSPTTYPRHREANVVLRDGSTVNVRPVRPTDRELLLAFLQSLSPDSRYFRFHSGAANLEQAVRWFVDVDYGGRDGLVATTGDPEVVVAHAGYSRIGAERAEIAFAVLDAYQGRGLGTILLGQLAEAAQEAGIAVFEALVLPANHQMVTVFRESGFPVTARSQPGVIMVEFPTSLSEAALQRFEGREQMAARAALQSFLQPRSVAVIGASRSRGTIGGEVFHNLLSAGFPGPVYPVNRAASVVQSVVAYPSIVEVPGPVDLAVIAVPAAMVVETARQCAAKGVPALVVISAGFAEANEGGKARQQELLAVCRQAGIRLIGPNCMGIINTAADVRLNATFAPTFPPPGRIGFLSQSGALGLAVIDFAASLGLGLSSFVSVGNKADISGNDLLQYWETDKETDLILLYLESFGNPRKFARIARRVTRAKPIVAVKSGRSAAGARATSSHTGAMLAASDAAVDALFHQAGVIRTDTLAELFDVAALVANQPLPAGRRVAILTNSGGPGILCADACAAHRLEVAPLPEGTRAALREFLTPEASLVNPVDMVATASADDYRRGIGVIAQCEQVDAIIVIFTPPLVTRAEEVAQAIRAAVRELPRRIPVLTVFLSARGIPDELSGADLRIPSYAFPEEAAHVLARAVQHSEFRARPQGVVPTFVDVQRDAVAGLIAAALAHDGGWLPPDEVALLLGYHGLPVVPWRVANTPEEAARRATELGGRVALKAVAPGLVHKTEVHGVRLDLQGPEVVAAAAQMQEELSRAGYQTCQFLVQQMAAPGVEMLVGVVHDRVFGPVVACGAGGTAVELLHDVAVRITPLTDLDAQEMVRSLVTYPLLDGYRGMPKVDVSALEDVLLRVSAMVEAHPEIAELDCNPVIVSASGATTVDARVRVEIPGPRLALGGRSV